MVKREQKHTSTVNAEKKNKAIFLFCVLMINYPPHPRVI